MFVTLDGIVQGLGRPDEDTRGGFTHGAKPGRGAAAGSDTFSPPKGSTLSC